MYIKSENPTDRMVVPPATATPPISLKMKMSESNTSTIMCPPIMLAKRRTIKAMGLVSTPNISMKGMMGRGALSATGTSGQNISFQYSLVPKMFTARKDYTPPQKKTVLL